MHHILRHWGQMGKGTWIDFAKDGIQMPTDTWKDAQFHKSWSAGQNHREDHLTPVRMAMIKKMKGNRGWWRCGEETLIHHLWECKFGQSLWKAVWRFLNKLKNYHVIQQFYLWNISRSISKWNEFRISKGVSHPHVHCSLIPYDRYGDRRPLMEEWMREMWHPYYSGMLFSLF